MTFNYDESADVLYVRMSEHKTPDCIYEETDTCIRRVAPSGELVGITVPFFLKRLGVLESFD